MTYIINFQELHRIQEVKRKSVLGKVLGLRNSRMVN